MDSRKTEIAAPVCILSECEGFYSALWGWIYIRPQHGKNPRGHGRANSNYGLRRGFASRNYRELIAASSAGAGEHELNGLAGPAWGVSAGQSVRSSVGATHLCRLLE